MSETSTAPGRQNSTTNHKPSDGSTNAEPKSASSTDRVVQQLRGNPLVALLIAGAASIAVVVALLMWASSPDYRVLYTNLEEADGGRIITELDARGIPYRFSEGGGALLVPDENVHALRLQLAEQGLPQGGNVGFELMETQAFGISQFAEQINYQRGLEGELGSSIESLGPVEKARVHLSMAKPSVFVRDREPAKASVVLTLLPGRVLGDGQVSAIVHMVSSSVPELAAEDVTVVNQNGRLLSADSRQNNDLDGSQLSYIAEVERSYQQRIERILTPLLGSDNVRAQVAAQIDFSRREETSERYGPNQPPNEAAVRSRQSSLSYDGDEALAMGIPGALSNTPPGAAPSPINLPDVDEEDLDEEQTEALQALRNLRQDDVVNYEVDRSIEHIQYRLGQIERLTAAVVVNFRDELNEEGVLERVPLTDLEVQQIEGLVRQAMGFSLARGDEVDVVNSPFTRAEEEAPLEWWQQSEILEMVASLGRYLLVGLAILLLYLLILRPLIKRYTHPPVMAGMPGGFQVSVGEDSEESENKASEDGQDVDDTYNKPKRQRKTSLYEHNLNDLREMAQEDPRMVAMIIRSWMNK
ncbi:flagellar basal-body MS-ring/collar protein FliF [Vreelandella rituensis]|uniref:Flagellar M-ring protein n=1 Tax=Vreelandella rituensis TaxID=2282306 RepID=A0A368TQK5_9GAMM|nr:flagellar basal-body MS-ring/collar protein FliF [Halomonas rituensis]RCV87005.1 flagellar basal body M-ring protein FliF [Halomonas rituensis]